MFRKTSLLSLSLALLLIVSACAPASPSDQTSEGSSASTEIPGHENTSTPEFLNEIGKTLHELKNEYP